MSEAEQAQISGPALGESRTYAVSGQELVDALALHVAQREKLEGWFKSRLEIVMTDNRVVVLNITLTRSR